MFRLSASACLMALQAGMRQGFPGMKNKNMPPVPDPGRFRGGRGEPEDWQRAHAARVYYWRGVMADPKQRLLKRMTNWQRNQCGRECAAKYGGDYKRMPEDRMEYFASLPRRGFEHGAV